MRVTHYIDELTSSSMSATEYTWTVQYVGDAAEALWSYLNRLANESSLNLYARYASVVQSSGTGKSRAVDEMSKKHFVIPINLRASGTTGYPPPDGDLQSFLCATQGDRYSLFCAFLQALFQTTVLALDNGLGLDSGKGEFKDDDRPEEIARKFREHMSSGMSTDGHGPYRRGFYRIVIEEMNKILKSKGSLKQAQQTLEDLVNRIVRKTVFPGTKLPDPLVIIAFDEAHTLTNHVYRTHGSAWSNFVELRRALHHYVSDRSLSTLFLSTTSKIDQLASLRSQDYSALFYNGNFSAYRPFVALGFDQFAKRLRLDGTEDFNSVITLDFIASYGRPLWGSIFLFKDPEGDEMKKSIVDYAAMKLLGGRSITSIKRLDEDQIFACLSRRLPIEFNSTDYVSHGQEKLQVEGHMRMCLKADAGFENIVTTSSSEPVLSEAAYFIMFHIRMDWPGAFQDVLSSFSVHKGDHGEMLVLLSQMMARDQAVSKFISYRRHGLSCSIPEFLGALFSPKAEIIHAAQGMVLGAETERNKGCELRPVSLEETFKNTIVYCTHWIKAHQDTIISASYLVGLFARGAAVLCSQSGIDGVTPYLYNSTKLAASNIGAIIWQSKNGEEYGNVPQVDLFTAMDPYSTGLFSVDEPTDVPVIRIVFALAAKEPSIEIVTTGKSDSGNRFTTYDIWVAGLGPEIFGVMTDKSVWEALLGASHGWADILRGVGPLEMASTMRMNPGVAEDAPFWNYWIGDHAEAKT
ncbi:hypothetical protein H1R20_g4866, partial [Candolleomyces eurysporus]